MTRAHSEGHGNRYALALDVIDVLHVYGYEPIGPQRMTRIRPGRYRADGRPEPTTASAVQAEASLVLAERAARCTRDAIDRGWERWKRRLRDHSVPHEIVHHVRHYNVTHLVRLTAGALEWAYEVIQSTWLQRLLADRSARLRKRPRSGRWRGRRATEGALCEGEA